MTAGARWLALALGLVPAVANGQTVSGLSEWTVARGANGATPSDEARNNAFWQRYSLGFDSHVWDSRLLKYDAQVSLLTNSLTFGGADVSRQGHQRNVGYKLGTTVFPRRPFPLFVQASRDTVAESGDFPSSVSLRGVGDVVPVGAAAPDSLTRNKALNIGWQLTAAGLPRVDVGYRKSNSVTSGGLYSAEQAEGQLHASVLQETARTHQTLRYDRGAFTSRVSQAFDQRLDNLNYDFQMAFTPRSRLVVRTGRRRSASVFELTQPSNDVPDSGVAPPSRGAIDAKYLVSSLTYEPSSRVSVDLTGSTDRQSSEAGATRTALGLASARVDPLPGLSLNVSGTYGDRGQVLNSTPITVLARSVQGGASYRAGVRWIDGSAAFNRGLGFNTTPDARAGRVESWSGQTAVSLTFGWFGVNGGMDRSRGRDDILDYGNYASERQRASMQTQAGPVSFSGTWERARIERGRDLSFAAARQETFTGSASYTLSRDSRVTANAGGFTNDRLTARDRTQFWGAAYEARLRPTLHLSVWGRRERTSATETHLDQRSLSWFAQLEYRLRLLTFTAEYRRSGQTMRYSELVDPSAFRGRQLLIRISRKFGLGL